MSSSLERGRARPILCEDAVGRLLADHVAGSPEPVPSTA